MNIEKLIERLKAKDFERDYDCTPFECGVFGLLDTAATALSTLQEENEKLLDENRRWSEATKTLSCAIENLRAELEQVKAERDAAVSWVQKYTESIDMPCVACKHNTGDYVCTAICGNCGPMGAESCKWEFDFSGELKED